MFMANGKHQIKVENFSRWKMGKLLKIVQNNSTDVDKTNVRLLIMG